jgi:hypothetical protein
MPPYVGRKVMNLRNWGQEFVKNMQTTLEEFEDVLEESEKWRSGSLKQGILTKVGLFFDLAQEILDEYRESKINEVNLIFSQMKLENLDELKPYKKQFEKGNKSLECMKEDFKKLRFSMIYLNKPSYQAIAQRIHISAEELKEAK